MTVCALTNNKGKYLVEDDHFWGKVTTSSRCPAIGSIGWTDGAPDFVTPDYQTQDKRTGKRAPIATSMRDQRFTDRLLTKHHSTVQPASCSLRAVVCFSILPC